MITQYSWLDSIITNRPTGWDSNLADNFHEISFLFSNLNRLITINAIIVHVLVDKPCTMCIFTKKVMIKYILLYLYTDQDKIPHKYLTFAWNDPYTHMFQYSLKFSQQKDCGSYLVDLDVLS